MDAKYDSALLGILQNEGKIEQFLHVIFGFLMRRTDFYHIMTEDNKKLGFPRGVNARMVFKTFEHYQQIFEEYENHRKAEAKLEEERKQTKLHNIAPSPRTTEPESKLEQDNSVPLVVSTEEVHSSLPTTSGSTEPQSTPSEKPANETKNDDEPGVYQADPDCYNGAVCDEYSWSQSANDVDIKVQVPSSVQSGRDVRVVVERKRICVYLKPQSATDSEQLHFDRELMWEILKDDAVWTLHKKESQIQFCLDKVQERWWEAAFVGEDLINIRKIDCSRQMHELDDEAQAKIHQMMYDQHQKRQGLPTSDQQKVHSILAKAWDQEGSPFRGTPLDLSSVTIATSNS